MKTTTSIPTRGVMLATVLASALAIGAGAPAAMAEEFTTVTDLDRFKAHFIGPKIMDPADSANFFVVREDGTIEGTWHGATLTGAWRWEDEYFCRTLSAPRPAPEDCQQWGYADGKAQLVRNRGAGDPTVYSLGE